jgi:hypothetical protein
LKKHPKTTQHKAVAKDRHPVVMTVRNPVELKAVETAHRKTARSKDRANGQYKMESTKSAEKTNPRPNNGGDNQDKK